VTRARRRPDRYLTTVLFTDIVDSTRSASELGDRRWHQLLEQHHELVRRELRRFGGREIDTAGDGFFAVFDAPARGVACALTIAAAMPDLGIQVRAGMHTGEVEEAGGKIRGIAVHIGARIGAVAGAGEVLVSSTVRDLVSGAGIDFEDRGTRELKGVPGEWHIYAGSPGARFREEFPVGGDTAGRDAAAARRTVELRSRRRRIVIGVGALIALALAGAVLFVVTRPPPSLARVDPNTAAVIDAATGRVLAQVAVGTRPDGITFGEGAIWTANTTDGTVSRIDPRTRAVIQTVDVGAAPSGLAAGFGSIWVANSGERTVSRINASNNHVVQTINVGNGPTAVASGAGRVWVTNALDGTISRIDPELGKVSGTFRVGASPGAVAANDSGVWVANADAGTVSRVDPATGTTLASIGVGSGPRALAFAGTALWVANGLDGTVSRIDPVANRVTATIEVGQGPNAIAGTASQVWVACALDGGVYRINPSTQAASRIDVGGEPQALTIANDELWLSARASTASHKGGTLRVVGFEALDSIDPAVAYEVGSWSVLNLTNDGLVAYRRTGGIAGNTLVPDLAVAVPKATDGGKTYTFQLRSGLVYSDGQPVKAGDFRRALERVFTVPSTADAATGAQFFEGIVGVAECERHWRTCDLSKGIVTDDGAGTVTFHLTAADGDFMQKLALPFASAVPPSVGNRDVGDRPVPATGPYMIASSDAKATRVIRNPRFRVWSRLAKPEGYPDEIVWTVVPGVEKQLDMIVAGSADIMVGSPYDRPDPERMERLRAQFPAQVHPWVSGTVFFYMNTKLAPFDIQDVRRAVNLAIDRTKLVDLLGGPIQAEAVCQVLLPSTQGYEPYCPYTANANAGGTWTAPDGVAAQRLVDASGRKGAPVTVVVVGPLSFVGVGQYLVKVLNDLGFTATLRNVDVEEVFAELFDPVKGPKIQSVVVAWFPDFPAASNTILPLFTCNDPRNLGRMCDATVSARIREALDLQQSDPAAAGQAWAAVDKLIVDFAPMAALVNQRESDFLAARVGNYQNHPEWKVLLDQLWVK
jgi:YVTN family beta-propeller protein